MPKIFISHSSKDKQFARQLALDLRELGHNPWLDEWEIRVGECIATKIETGLAKCEYVIIVLSASSVNSGWVQKEWKAKYWEEIETGTIMVLPVLIEECEMPLLLKTKRYADFRKSSAIGMVQLMGAFNPLDNNSPSTPINAIAKNTQISELIELIHSKTVPLSQCIAKALALATTFKIETLEYFCRHELIGWEKEARIKQPKHRVVTVYASLMQINMQYIGWGGSAATALAHIKNDSDNFIPTKMVMPHPIAELEKNAFSDASNRIMSVSGTLGSIFPDSPRPDLPVFLYGAGSTHSDLVESTRRELTRLLIEILPG